MTRTVERETIRKAALTRTLTGLLGKSDRPDFRRQYFAAELDYYADSAWPTSLRPRPVLDAEAALAGLPAARQEPADEQVGGPDGDQDHA